MKTKPRAPRSGTKTAILTETNGVAGVTGKTAGNIMKSYEIRILPLEQTGVGIYSSSHINDHAAIRRAIALAKSGEAIEVWCGSRCVYAGTPPGPIRDRARNLPASL